MYVVAARYPNQYIVQLSIDEMQELRAWTEKRTISLEKALEEIITEGMFNESQG